MINGDGPTLLEKIPEYESIIKDLSKHKQSEELNEIRLTI